MKKSLCKVQRGADCKLHTYGKVCLFYEKHSINIILNFGTKNLVEQYGDFGLKIQNYESKNHKYDYVSIFIG